MREDVLEALLLDPACKEVAESVDGVDDDDALAGEEPCRRANSRGLSVRAMGLTSSSSSSGSSGSSMSSSFSCRAGSTSSETSPFS